MTEQVDQKVVIGDTEVWKHRTFQEWHFPFPDLNGPIMGCFNGNCTEKTHLFGCGMDDPAAKPLLDLFRGDELKGKSMLLQNDYCDPQRVNYLTYSGMHTLMSCGSHEFFFAEPSRELYYYAYPRTDIDREFGVRMFWDSLRYVAIVNDPTIAAFSMPGGREVFVEELARSIGLGVSYVDERIAELDNMNAPDLTNFRMKVPRMTYMSDIYDAFANRDKAAVEEALARTASSKPKEIAVVIGVITQQGRLRDFVELTGGQLPLRNKGLFEANLILFADAYQRSVPDSQDKTKTWFSEWNESFGLKLSH